MRPEAEIVVAGMACRFPDADDPAALFENSLAGRQSFRPIPPSRLPLDLYAADRIGEDDSITAVPAGLLADWRFDTARFRVPRGAFASADLSHWLALEVAVEAVEAAGGIDRLDGARTAVVVANTLTGEFSRAALLRLRWPWLDELLAEALDSAELEGAAARRVRANFRDRVRGAFPAPTEESLAGGLANTIAGRIANQLDLRGGAWSVDAACASSLVALAAAADLIAAGRADAAIVAAVDLSLDPFELVGFSRNGALAPRRMRVFDARAEGFWPGEGAGAVILMSGAAARRSGCDADLRLAGWAVSSDGSGGLTRPDAQGQRRALDAAYRQAGIDPATLGYVEAHGTGTAVGDPVEVGALAGFLGPAAEGALPIGSIKANIGHTKAAAGLAGLIRTAAAIRAGIVPPHVGCEEPHPIFAETGHRLRVPVAPEPWRAGPRAAGISGFGFGGVNAHAVLSAPARAPARPLPPAPPARNGDLFLFGGRDAAALAPQLRAFADRAASLTFAELGDASAALARAVAPGPLRLAFSAEDPGRAGRRAEAALAALAGGTPAAGIRIGTAAAPPRIGFVFPGQAAPARTRPGAWGHRFPGLYPRLPDESDPTRTDRAQPLIARACLAGLDLLAAMGVAADAAVGHSLGELVALAWSGAIPAAALAELAAARGRAMGAVPPGAMLQMSCDAAAAEALAAGEEAGVACYNGARETVLSGTFAAVAEVERRALAAGMACQRLAVSHAFHAASMAAAAPALAEALAGLTLSAPARPGRAGATDRDPGRRRTRRRPRRAWARGSRRTRRGRPPAVRRGGAAAAGPPRARPRPGCPSGRRAPRRLRRTAPGWSAGAGATPPGRPKAGASRR